MGHLEVDGLAEPLHGVEEVVGEVGGGEGEGEHLAGVAVSQEIHHLRQQGRERQSNIRCYPS